MSEEDEKAERAAPGGETAEAGRSQGEPRPAVAPGSQVIPITAEAVRAHLGRPQVLAGISAFVRSKVRERDVEDVAGAVHVAILSANVRPSSVDALPFWIQTIAARVVADHTRRGKRRGKYGGEMPDLDASVVDDSVFHFGAREPAEVNVTPWLERQVAESPRDAETLEILKEKAQTKKTYEELAGALGLSEATLKKRVARFADKYAERRERANRERGLLLLLLLATGSAVVIYVLMKWVWTPRFEPIGRDPTAPTEPSRTVPPAEEEGVSSPHPDTPAAP